MTDRRDHWTLGFLGGMLLAPYFLFAVVATIFGGGSQPSAALDLKSADPVVPSVGVASKISQLILPGTELEPQPLVDRQAKVVVRVVDVYPHGTSFRYDLSYYGLEPGTYNLADYLKRKDGTTTAGLPAIPVTIRAILAPGQIEPNSLRNTPSAFRGYYRVGMFLAAVAWFLGLLAIVFVGRKKARVAAEAGARPLTMADRLRPLVDRAVAGTLEPAERAELERTLIDYWRRRLGLEALGPGKAIALIRADGQAGALLRQLEGWLHRPPGEGERVDVAALLEPYRVLPAEPEPAAAVGGSAR